MERINLSNRSFEKMIIDTSKEIEIHVKKNVQASLAVMIQNKAQLDCRIFVEEQAHLKVLFWNESEAFQHRCEVFCERGAQIEMNVGEMSEGEMEGNFVIHLQKEESSLVFKSACAAAQKKHFNIECIHEAAHTLSQMENYAVIYENSDFKLVDTGRILQGAYDSNSHQTSRALILSEHQKCEMLPILLIDENDVQASHATTMGQIDENQLYYLQTRGLTKTQALGLITIGYLMPIASCLDNEELTKELSAKIERKVGLA